jgi:hypothetical protein
MNRLKSKTNHRWYYCRICMKRHTSYYMSEICASLDLKVMEQKERKLVKIEK